MTPLLKVNVRAADERLATFVKPFEDPKVIVNAVAVELLPTLATL